MEVSILSEKAASILGIAPPKHYKRASSYDPLTLQKAGSDGVPHQPRSYSFHPGLKRGKTIDKMVSVDSVGILCKSHGVSQSQMFSGVGDLFESMCAPFYIFKASVWSG